MGNMPTVTFDERTVSDLALLQSLPVEGAWCSALGARQSPSAGCLPPLPRCTAVGEFARIASDFTLKGARPKQFERAAGAFPRLAMLAGAARRRLSRSVQERWGWTPMLCSTAWLPLHAFSWTVPRIS